nr:hypothetical protein [Candidatus Freyarchaeota archaeon]
MQCSISGATPPLQSAEVFHGCSPKRKRRRKRCGSRKRGGDTPHTSNTNSRSVEPPTFQGGEYVRKNLYEYNISGRLGDIHGRPNENDLREVAEKAKGILKAVTP